MAYVDAETSVEKVRVYVDQLRGEARRKALEAAVRLRRCKTLGEVDAELSATAFEGAVDVTAIDGGVGVTMRPEHAWELAALTGYEAPSLTSLLALRLSGVLEANEGPRWRLLGETSWCPVRDMLRCMLKAGPTSHAWPFIPSLELGMGLGGVMGVLCPSWQASGHLVLTDVLGRHALKLGASSRELRPPRDQKAFFDGATPLQSSKTSASRSIFKSCSKSF